MGTVHLNSHDTTNLSTFECVICTRVLLVVKVARGKEVLIGLRSRVMMGE